MPKTSLKELQKTLRVPALPDFALLARAIEDGGMKDLFAIALDEAKAEFKRLEKIPTMSATHATVVAPLLAMDRELAMLWEFAENYHRTEGTKKAGELLKTFQPKLTALGDATLHSVALYELLKAVQRKDELTPVQQRSLQLLLEDRELEGVQLPTKAKKELQAINAKLGKLGIVFVDHVTKSRNTYFVQVKDEHTIASMPMQDKEAAKHEAAARKLSGSVFTLSPPSYRALMRYCSDRAIRKKTAQAYMAVATKGKEDNRPLVIEMLRLRRRKAELLGYKHYAAYALKRRMVQSPKQAMRMSNEIATKAKQKARKEFAMLKKENKTKTLELWDIGFATNRAVEKLLKIDESVLQEYFPLAAVMDGIFSLAHDLFGVMMQERKATSYHPDVATYEVWRDGKLHGYFLLDVFARVSKKPGAWCGIMRGRREGILPVIINVSNIGKATKGQSTVPHIEVRTLFHEFGHALHTLLCEQTEGNLGAFHTELDFVELPSQLLENWCWDTESLSRFAKNGKGEAIPASLIRKLQKKQTFVSGFDVLAQMHYAILDMTLHTVAPPKTVRELDRLCLQIARRYSVPPHPSWYAMHPQFSHIFSGGYGAGYYSYIWSEILEADVAEVFRKKGMRNKQLGEKLRKTLYAPGALKPGAELFHSFMGREPSPNALMKKRGL